MSKRVADDTDWWDQILEHFDLMSTRMNDMGITQQEPKTQIQLNNSKVEQCCKRSEVRCIASLGQWSSGRCPAYRNPNTFRLSMYSWSFKNACLCIPTTTVTRFYTVQSGKRSTRFIKWCNPYTYKKSNSLKSILNRQSINIHNIRINK